ncbi:hypothetical protein [Methylomagnum sp.]
MTTPTDRLRAIADTLLDISAPPSQALAASHALTDLFASLEGFDAGQNGTDYKHRLDTYTAHGKALSPINAARCAWEHLRTTRFLQGAHAALREAQRRFPGQRIEVLYAGTGPYATLVLPLLPRFSPEALRLTLLDIHPHCLDSVARLLEGLGLGGFVREFVVADATRYRHPSNRPPHVVITETMQKALIKEPQVAITLNLALQLAPGGLLVPERVDVRACLADPSREMPVLDAEGNCPERARVDLGKVFELSLDTARAWAKPDLTDVAFPPARVAVPEPRPESATRFMLLTHIATFGEIGLGDYDCSLTCPVEIRPLRDPAPGLAVELRYRMDASPGFEHQALVRD